MAPSQPPPPPPPTGIPEEVAEELAAYIRASVSRSLTAQINSLETRINAENDVCRSGLQDVQSQISAVLQPSIEQLLEIAQELEDTYKQIDILDRLVNRTIAPTISDLSSKLDRTEQLVRRQERALNAMARQASSNSRGNGGSSGRGLEVWRGVEMGDVNARRRFVAGEWFDEGGRLVDPKA